MTVANAVEEAKKENRDFEVHYWRTLKADGYLNEKFPGGVEFHKGLLENEGFKVLKKGSRYCVENYQVYMVRNLEIPLETR